MAEVALLVAEDYERRTRSETGWAAGKKGERAGSKREHSFRALSSFAGLTLGRKARETAAAVRMDVEQRAAELRSSVGLAAVDGLFSA